MKFDIGEKIRIEKPFLYLGRNHIGAIGEILEHRCYCKRLVGHEPTHYVVKFECYKIPHIFMKYDLEECCESVSGHKTTERAKFHVRNKQL